MTLKQADILKLVIGGVAAIGFATAVSAKGHDQGQTTTPGEDVQTETRRTGEDVQTAPSSALPRPTPADDGSGSRPWSSSRPGTAHRALVTRLAPIHRGNMI